MGWILCRSGPTSDLRFLRGGPPQVHFSMVQLQKFCLGGSITSLLRLRSEASPKWTSFLEPQPPMGLSSELGDLVRDRKCSCLLRLGLGEVLSVLGKLSAYLQKGHYLRKHYLSKQPGRGCSSSPANQQHFRDEHGKAKQEREALGRLDEPML